MPKLIVVSDSNGDDGGRVTFEEYVLPAHVETEHSATQLIERVSWAIRDAASDQAANAAKPTLRAA